MARRYRPRKLFKFWLYHDLAEDTRLMEYIQYLHKTRQFATMIRNGLRLMWTLGEGDTSVLFELFPTLRRQFTPDNTALLEEFRRMLQAQAALVPQLIQHESTSESSPKALPAPHVIAPVPDDEDTVVIRRDTSAGQSTTLNFLKASLGLQGIEDLPDDDPPDDKPVEVTMPGIKEIPGMKDIPMPVFNEDDELIPSLPTGSMKLKKLA